MPKCTVQGCNVKGCVGPDELRRFADWHDLADHLGEETIVTFVNRFAEIADEYMKLKERAEANKQYHQRNQEKKRLLLRAAKTLLSPDEILELERRGAEAAAKKAGH